MSVPPVYRDPSNRQFTDAEMALLSNIFRVIVKEITSDEDKNKLAPGEIGIDYIEGVIYAKNPHTGNLVTPNSLPGIRDLIAKIDDSGRLNADKLGGIRVYDDLAELARFNGPLTPDNLIAFGMADMPSLFIGVVQGNRDLGWPTENGILLAYKYNEETVAARFLDRDTFVDWIGQYDYVNHRFIGWSCESNTGPYVVANGGDNVELTVDTEPIDLLGNFIVRVTNGLIPGATVSLNGRPSVPIVEPDGSPLSYQIAENNTIMLAYDEPNDRWVLYDAGETATLAGIDILRRRVLALTRDVLDLANSTTTSIGEITDRLDGIDSNLSNFDAAWVKSINGSKLPLDVIPSGALERLYRISTISILADSSATGYPSNVENGDTIQALDTALMYYVTDASVLGTPNYTSGINIYTAGGATSVEWANVQSKPTTLSGYGITDGATQSAVQSLDDQLNSANGIAARLASAESTIQSLVTIIGTYGSASPVSNRLDTIETQINGILTNPGDIDLVITNYTATTDGETGVSTITGFNGTFDKLFVNYGQTILKVGIDYNVVGNGVAFTNLTLGSGDIVQFIIFKQKTS